MDSELGIDSFRNHLESLFSNNKVSSFKIIYHNIFIIIKNFTIKAIVSPPMASSITLVALNQISESTSLISATQANSSQQNTISNTNSIQAAANQSSVSHSNPILPNAGTQNSTVAINQSHQYQQQQQPPHTSIFNQQQIQIHQQIIHNIPIQNQVQQMAPHQTAQQHHLHLQQSQVQGAHIQQQTIASNVTTSMQHPQVLNQVPSMQSLVQNHAGSIPSMHHQIVTNQTPQQQQLHQQQPTPPSHMITPQNMMVSAPGPPTSQSNEYSYQNQIALQGYQTVYAQTPQTLPTIPQPIDSQNTNLYSSQINYPSQQQQQQQYSIQQQQYQMQRSGSAGSFSQPSSVPGQRLVVSNPSQIQSPNQMIMMNNRPATTVGVSSQMPQGLLFHLFSLKIS